MTLNFQEQMQFIHRYIKKTLAPSDEKRLKRIQEQQPQQRIHFLDEFLKIEPGKELDTTRIGYKPLESASYSPSELALAPPSQNIDPSNRKLTRYRLVYGPVDFYLDDKEKPLEITLISACAPNLMGSSQVDLREFSFADKTDKSAKPKRVLKAEAYEKECIKLANFIVGTVKQENKKRLIMPTFGVGAYIRQLNDSSKRDAQRIMYQAFASAAQEHQIQVDWIIKGTDENPAKMKLLNGFSPNNPYMKPSIQSDILQYTQKLVGEQESLVLLNPGSDRTIGGAYTTENPDTLEEQYSQKSDLLLLHSALNPSLVNRFKQDLTQRKNQIAPQLTVEPKPRVEPKKSPRVSSSPSFFNPNLKSIAEKIQKHLDLKEVPKVSKHHENYKISFKQKSSAEKLNRLYKNNKLPIHHEKTYFVVHLSQAQVQDLETAVQSQKKLQRKNSTVDRFLDAITGYENRRKAYSGSNPEYKVTFLGFGFGFSKTQKLAATKALKNVLGGGTEDLHSHLPALKNGELSLTINNFLKNNALFPHISIKNVAELVDYLEHSQAKRPGNKS